MKKNTNKYKLSQERHDNIYKLLEQRVFGGKESCEFPVAVVLGGQPGAGKSVLIENSIKEFENSNFVIINGDEYRRVHPYAKEILNYNEEDFAFYTDPDVRIWTNNLFNKAIEEKYNLIFEGTMRTNAICKTLKRIKENGFNVKIKVLSVNAIDSLLSTMERYEEQKNAEGHGRMTPPESHRAAYYGMLDTLEEIEKEKYFDILEVLTRNEEIVYYNDIKQDKTYSKYEMGLRETLIKSREEIKPSMTEVEKRLKLIEHSRERRGDIPIEIDDILENIHKLRDNNCI